VKPCRLLLKIHPNAGIVGLGEPSLEGRTKTWAEAVKEIEPYLVGKEPRRVVHHWQSIYRHAFYRGGPLLTSALSGIHQALWDIKGGRSACPCTDYWAAPRATRSACTPLPAPRTCTRSWRKASPPSKRHPPRSAPCATSEPKPRSSTPPERT
jgi:L-alanine-DL-glutamate epimerase-like enolase superfamily enzyme